VKPLKNKIHVKAIAYLYSIKSKHMKSLITILLLTFSLCTVAQKSFSPFWQIGLESQIGYWKPYNKFDRNAPDAFFKYKKNKFPNTYSIVVNAKYYFSKYLGIESGLGYQQNKTSFLGGQFNSGYYYVLRDSNGFDLVSGSGVNGASVTDLKFKKIFIPLGIVLTSSDKFIEQFELSAGINLQYIYNQSRKSYYYDVVKNGDTLNPDLLAQYLPISYIDRSKLKLQVYQEQNNSNYFNSTKYNNSEYNTKKNLPLYKQFIIDAFIKLQYKKTFDNNLGFSIGGFGAISLFDIENKKSQTLYKDGSKHDDWSNQTIDSKGQTRYLQNYANGMTYVDGYYNNEKIKYPLSMKRPKTISYQWGINLAIHYQFRNNQ
jgi:hypothetical protein